MSTTTENDPLEVARAKLAEIREAERADSVERDGLEQRRAKRAEARAKAEQELAQAEAKIAAAQLERELPAAIVRLDGLGGELRQAFEVITKTTPALLATQAHVDTMVAKARTVEAYGHRVRLPAAPRLAGFDRAVLAYIEHAIKAHEVSTAKKKAGVW